MSFPVGGRWPLLLGGGFGPVALSWGDRYAKGGGVNREEREAYDCGGGYGHATGNWGDADWTPDRAKATGGLA